MTGSGAAPPRRIGRRGLLRGAAGLAGLGLAGPGSAEEPAPVPARWTVPYGAAITPDDLAAGGEPYRAAVLRYCSQIVLGGGMKWIDVRPERDAFDYAKGDAYVAFARRYGLTPRGHTLVWAGAMPAWTEGIGADEAEALMTGHVRTMIRRYAATIRSWDVVNEPIAEKPTGPDDLRPSIWLRRLGPAYIETALRAAAEADPLAQLVINDYDLEYAGEPYRTRRAAMLQLARNLRRRGVPLHAVGLQGHLRAERDIDRQGLDDFVRALADLGVGVLVTELDVIDFRLPGPAAAVDAAVAATADAFLGALFAAARPQAVLTWGITDRFTWVPTFFKRSDGLPNRPLPLDADYREKPLMRVIERYCR